MRPQAPEKSQRRKSPRIALLHPTYWPEVRRGSERFIHGLALYLVGRGYGVSIITSHPAIGSRSREDGIEVVRNPRLPAGVLDAGRFEPHLSHLPFALASLLAGRFDLAHAFHISDAWVAARWSRLRRRPLVMSLMGYPDRQSLDAYRGRRRLLRAAARQAAAVHVLSASAAEQLRLAAGLDAISIPPGVTLSDFRVSAARATPPTIFCAAAIGDPRKGVRLLLEALALVRRRRPDVRLLLDHRRDGGPAPEWTRAEGIELVDTGGGEGLARAYAGAWVSALPSVREAFGLVLVESLAAGTPVVGSADGSIPEVVSDPAVGRLFRSGDAGDLARALLEGLDLAAHPETRDLCREHAARWDWQRVGPRFEHLYELGSPIASR